MSDGRAEFEHRLNRFMNHHRALARGRTATIRPDGLIVLQPRRIQFRMPLRGFVLLMVIFMAFKGYMLASMGDVTYGARLVILAGGTLYERAGAFVMGLDPVSKVIADLLGHLV